MRISPATRYWCVTCNAPVGVRGKANYSGPPSLFICCPCGADQVKTVVSSTGESRPVYGSELEEVRAVHIWPRGLEQVWTDDDYFDIVFGQ